MPQTKTAAPVLQHRDGQTKNFITCILPYISPICKAFANFTLTACGLGALCAVAALAQGGGAAAMAGLACCLLGGWAAITLRAAVCITDLMQRTGKFAAEIASDMIEFAYQHCEVQK